MTVVTLIDTAFRELALVVGALLDASASATAATAEVETHWSVSLTISGPSKGSIVFGFDASGARALARQVMGLDDEPADAAVADTLVEVCGQAMSSVSQQKGFEGLRFTDAKVVARPPLTEPLTFSLVAGDRFSSAIDCWATLSAPAVTAPAATALVVAQAPTSSQAGPANLELILDIELPLTVRFGETEMTLLSLTRLAPGSIIDLGRSPDDPVDVLVNGRLVARAEVVVVSGNYGVRIVEVISAADRLKTVAA